MTENQKNIVSLYLEGETITNIAKIVGVSRQTVYNNMQHSEVKAAIDVGLANVRKNVSDKITASSEVYISELAKIALTSKDEKLRAQCLQYMLDHCVGKATARIENTSSTPSENVVEDIDSMLKELNNLVELPGLRAK